VENARRTIESRGIYGNLSADDSPPGRLPYADNLVNLLVADEFLYDRGTLIVAVNKAAQ